MATKFLTIRQPWASLIAVGAKTIETRGWSTKYRGPIAIHAGAASGGWNEPATDAVAEACRTLGLAFEDWPRGAVIAVAELVEVLPVIGTCTVGEITGDPPAAVVAGGASGLCIVDFPEPQAFWTRDDDIAANRPLGDFAIGNFAWMLDSVCPVHPVAMKGAQGLRDLPPEIEAQLREIGDNCPGQEVLFADA